jgi:RNA polymerase sigma factor (sigma-70 family)
MDPDRDLSPALEITLRRFAGEVRRTAGRFGLAGDDVDELEQEVRLRLWKALKTGEKIEAAPASYVQRVARSAAIDLFRHRRARPEDPLPDDPDRGPMTPPAAEPAIAQGEFMGVLGEAIAGLVASRQGAVRMYLAGYPREEIADLMGWSEAKTRNLIYRGLEDLRERLTAMGVSQEATV